MVSYGPLSWQLTSQFRGSIRDITDETNATRAYAILGFSWGLGGVIGPVGSLLRVGPNPRSLVASSRTPP